MRKSLCLITALLGFQLLQAQQVRYDSLAPAPPKPDKDALKFNLNESGSHFFQVTFLNQAWFRLNQSNPNTYVDGDLKNNTFDIGLRRTRIQMYGQITDKVFLYFQFGQNNFNSQYNYNPTGSLSRKNAPFFHDAVVEYKFSKANQLKIGGGLTIVNGLSRFSQPSIATIMTMDVPVFAQATVDQTDEFSRKLSLYARGQVGKFDYRIVISDPFPINTTNSPINPAKTKPTTLDAKFAEKGHTHQFQSYLMYQFFEHENHTTPGYMTGTYLGKKKVFNIAAGVIAQPNATWYKDVTRPDSVAYAQMLLWSVESFLDMPFNKTENSAISAYAGYYHMDYGRNYLRYNGIMNPATQNPNTTNYISGSYGNAFPMFGTGNVFYTQFGYLLPDKVLGKGHSKLMPYASWMYANYDALQSKPMNVFNAGLNWLIKGHNAKMTLDYQNRPTFKLNGAEVQTDTRRGCLTLQYQIYI